MSHIFVAFSFALLLSSPLFAASQCIDKPEGFPSPAQISVIESSMGHRNHRLMHYLWHGLRDGWHVLSEEERTELIRVLPPHIIPPRPIDYSDNVHSRNNNSGEDFLYMHRVMIKHLNHQLAHKNLCAIAGWRELPLPSDERYPVDPAGPFSDDKWLARMQENKTWLENKEYMRHVTLGQFGYDIEWSLHGLMHMRWMAASPFPERPAVPLTGEINDPNWIYDDPRYNFLADPYAAHVNPIFWKLHGWIDDRINDWLAVNGYTSLAVKCPQDDSKCYEWKATWIGTGMSEVLAVMSKLKDLQPDIRDSITAKLQIGASQMSKRAGS